MDTALPTFSTTPLLLRPLELADAPAIQRVFAQWEIVRYLTSQIPWPYPADGALTFLRDFALPAMARGTEWHWTIRPRGEPECLIGMLSLREEAGNNRGFWLAPQWQGQGLMQEACTVATDYWFETLDKPLLQAPKALPNIVSRRISERSGMRLVATRESDYVAGRLLSQIWEITREEWREQRRL
ncbi:GNAT family N-acetyltransferase [Pseudomonas sp. BMS12]|uniref:GNAT family N-acetyltransferase n=1 Tax=Pseudomonas sp. BMS12 TaxID=1796033 RepID=UPI00083A1A43|nr:GNAT family N-acetyltransferase [Pseudomonas sp. BMS12]